MRLKIGDEIQLKDYDKAWIGWITKSSYQISKIKSILNKNGKTSRNWLWENLEIEWVLKKDFKITNKNKKKRKQTIMKNVLFLTMIALASCTANGTKEEQSTNDSLKFDSTKPVEVVTVTTCDTTVCKDTIN